MKKIILTLVTLLTIGNCAMWEDTKTDYESDTKGLNRKVEIYTLDGKLLKKYRGIIRIRRANESGRITLNLISENNRRITIDNAIVISEQE